MRALIVTENCGVVGRGGGSRLVATLIGALGRDAAIVQFGEATDGRESWHYRYPDGPGDRFARRLANAGFITERVRELAPAFTHVLFVHVSMQFGFASAPLDGIESWTFPMFLTPSYVAAGEVVPPAYTQAERGALEHAQRVLTPSHLERRQLVDLYGVPEERIRVVPRGVELGAAPGIVRALRGPLELCAIGSIKRQKNTIGLLHAFAAIRARHGGARLRVIGPIQDAQYAGAVVAERARLGLERVVDLMGYVPHDQLPAVTADVHLHVSASRCETFGRAIFETLAMGIPNVARATDNAAAEFLHEVPYARFEDDPRDFAAAVDELLADLPTRSQMAFEVGEMFEGGVLARLLVAELRDAEILAVSDWDGTLFHKGDSGRTRRSVAAFRAYGRRVVATARSLADTLAALEAHDLSVDWIVAFSGAVIANGRGEVVWQSALPQDDVRRLERIAGARRVEAGGLPVQIAVPSNDLIPDVGDRVESYGGTSFVSRWHTSKLRAVHRLLGHLGWTGRVRAFGDGRYDEELLAFFDGTRILAGRSAPGAGRSRHAEELGDVGP